jgi:Protein of unknown function (DUF2844)
MYPIHLVLIIIMVAVFAPQSQASLGKGISSIDSDRSALAGQNRGATEHERYTIQTLGVGNTEVREYLSLSGVVFGLGWNGPHHPDLKQLLGDYYGDFQNQSKIRQGRRRTGGVQTDHLVVRMWGHMRNQGGRAYDPTLIPQGVSVDEIR